ncbi:type II secretion system F family protein [Vibrio sp. AK197]
MESMLSFISGFQVSSQMIFLIMLLISTVLIVITIVLLVVGKRSPLKVKLEQIKSTQGLSSGKKTHRFENTLESLAPVMTPKSLKERESVRHQLMHAGFHDASALTTFYALKGSSLALGFGVAAGIYFIYPNLDNMLWFIMCTSVAAGTFVPNIILHNMVKKRKFRLRGGVPDALDLLVVCTESGLGFNAALRRVADELALSHPDFADELDTVCAKIKAGVDISDAFNDLIERTGVVEISGLVTMLSHASRIGGSLSQSLREYTEDYRDKRNQEIEELAAKIPTKMIFPMLIFIWPCFFIVAIGPSLLMLADAFGK